MAMNSSESIANALAPYIALRRTPEAMNKLFALADTVTPQDVRDIAARYLKDSNRTIVTLSTKKGNDAAKGGQR